MVHILNNPESLIPFNSTSIEEINIEDQIFETLLRMDPITHEPDMPWLAEALPVESNDHKQYDFTLRKGIKFADGTKLTGADVIFSLKAAKNPFGAGHTTLQSSLDWVQRAELVDGDPYKIRFIVSKPYWQIRQFVFASILTILPKHIFDPKNFTDAYSWDDIDKLQPKNYDELNALKEQMPDSPMVLSAQYFEEISRDPDRILGSGPYQIEEWRINDRVALKKNPNYRNRNNSEFGKAYPDRIIYKQISDPTAAVTALKTKYLDVIGYLQLSLWKNIDTTSFPFLSKTAFPQSSFAYIGWNIERPYFRDQKVRLALAHLIDRKMMIDTILYGQAEQIQSVVPKFRREYNSNIPLIDYNPETARRLLKEAGWEDHDGDGIIDKRIGGKLIPFKFSFICNAGNLVRRNCLLVLAESFRQVGIQADVYAVEWSVLLDNLRNHNFDATYGAWQNDEGETDNYQLYHSSQTKNNGSNFGNWKSKRADSVLEAIRNEMDAGKRQDLEKEFQQIFYEEQPVALLWSPYTAVVWNNRFDNVKWYSLRQGYNPAWWIPRK
ncbi:MAG: ABC transporter substrate-binding protein [Bacteroidota bacterium]|nr:ABC transporter substrate-binding protein [Bacteroidota bacterium]